MNATYEEFVRALEFLVEIEPDPEQLAELAARAGIDDMMMRRELQAPCKDKIEAAHEAIRAYGQHIAHQGLAYMQNQLYDLIEQDWSAMRQSVMVSTTNQLWNGLGDWRA